MRWELAVVGSTLAAALAWQARRDQIRAQAWRVHLFDDCDIVLARSTIRIDRAGWPVLHGEIEGIEAACSLVLDDLGYRKLPVLWLSVTLAIPVGVGASFDALAREQGTEFFSPAAELPVRLPLPAAWPRYVCLRADREVPLPPALEDLGMRFFGSAQAKEIVVSPKGVRLVSLVAEGRRAEYLVLRRPRFDLERVDPAIVAARLAEARALMLALHANAAAERRAACDAKNRGQAAASEAGAHGLWARLGRWVRCQEP